MINTFALTYQEIGIGKIEKTIKPINTAKIGVKIIIS